MNITRSEAIENIKEEVKIKLSEHHRLSNSILESEKEARILGCEIKKNELCKKIAKIMFEADKEDYSPYRERTRVLLEIEAMKNEVALRSFRKGR